MNFEPLLLAAVPLGFAPRAASQGIKRWATAGPNYIDQMEEYDKDAWEKASEAA